MSATVIPLRKPRYAYFETRPADGLPLTMWAIERQLSLASDYGEADLVAVLAAMNPDLDESIMKDIEALIDLGEFVDNGGDRDTSLYQAIDDYYEHLRKLALLVRGAR